MPKTLFRAVNRPNLPQLPVTEADAYLPMTEEAAVRFVADWTPSILSQMARFRLPADLAEDAAQEALLRAMRALPNFQGKSKLSTWIFSIAWREGLRANQRWQRLQKREVSAPGLGSSEGIHPDLAASSSMGDPLARAAGADEVARVQLAMDHLPDRQRLALGYHYLEELSVEEIAQLMKAPPGTVKSWLKRGRDKLRHLLNNGANR